jgi:hypothetical protein
MTELGRRKGRQEGDCERKKEREERSMDDERSEHF